MDLSNLSQSKEQMILSYGQHVSAACPAGDADTGAMQQASMTSQPPTEEALVDNKWVAGYVDQFAVLYARSFAKARGDIFTSLNIKQCIALAIIAGLCWLQIQKTEASISDRSAFIFFALTFWFVREHLTLSVGKQRRPP